MNAIKVGLIGYGFSGATFHAPFLRVLDEFELVAIMSSDAMRVHRDMGNVRVVSTIDEILQDDSIELVVITTPNSLHYEMAKESILHEKHVIVEKPMVIEPSEAVELISLAKKKGVMLSVYQNRRWDNDFLTIKKLIQKGIVGEITTYEAHFDRFRPHVRDRWREKIGKGAGMLYDLGSHLIDQALHLFGMPQFVMADVFAQRKGGEVDDYFHIIMGYENLRVVLHSGSIVMGQGPKFLIHGSKGSYIKYGLDIQESKLRAGENPLGKDFGKDEPDMYGRLITEEDGTMTEQRIATVQGNYAAYYQGIYEHIRFGKSNPVTADDGLQTITIIHAAMQSSRERRTVTVSRLS
ncbi:oxidoreductase [Ectobacillus sp. sgz5001026]|uniref:oxidoreductase n=1 Tax=Ectobacillus sp. sgz5001026 TaxID=3242473 RepID=UPI0036D3FE4D